ncbi:TPA: hypothetical protein SML49_001138 [Serratia marcescens]|nr:hypothetical protein [Serratia marcescens]
MDKLREEFEKWLEEIHGLYGEDVEWQEKRNCYAKFGIHLAYQAWLASRELIVVDIESHTEFEIEHMISPEKEGYSIGWIDGRNYAAKQVRSIGLSIKGE